MRNVITAILALWLVTGTIYHVMVVGELQSNLYVEKELNMACTAQLMWVEMQLNDI